MSTWVFLRGLAREARHWGKFPEAFRAAVPDARVEMPDLPGTGRWCGLDSPTRIRDIADFVRADLITQGFAPPYHLLALSLGGMVAIEWASRHPDEVAGCVLVNTSARPFGHPFERLRPRQYLPLLMASVARNPRARERLVLAATSRLVGDDPELIRTWSDWYRECPISFCNTLRQLCAAARYRAPVQRPAVPVLILVSACDAIVAPACSARLAGHWRAPLGVHTTAGHDLPLDDARWVAEQVRTWQDTLPSVAAACPPLRAPASQLS